MSETDGTEPWTDSEQLEAIERELKIAKRSNSIAVYVRVDALRVVADHARRSVEAEAAEGERHAAAVAMADVDGFGGDAGAEDGYTHLAEAALIASSLWRAAHPVPVAIDEAMVRIALQAYRTHPSTSYESAMHAALTAALNPQEPAP